MRKLLAVPAALLMLGTPAWAGNTAETEYAVGQILAQQGALFVSYHIGENGKISVLFGANEPEWRVKNTVEALQSHPDLAGRLFWSRTDSEFCAIR